MGRPPRVFSDDEIDQVERLAPYLTQAQLADYFGIGEATLRRILARDDRVSIAYKKGKARAIGLVAQNLVQAALKGDRTAQIFYLKTQGGWRETGVIEHEYPAWMERMLAMTPDELEAIEDMDDEQVIRLFELDDDGEPRRVAGGEA